MDNPETTTTPQAVCPACGQNVRTSGAIDYATIIGGRVPTSITVTRLDRTAEDAVQRAYGKAAELAGRSSTMKRASEVAADRLEAAIEAAEAIAHDAREQLAELALEREATTRAANEMMEALLALGDPDARRQHTRT